MEKSGVTLGKLVDLATGFVTRQQGAWDHASWQDFVDQTQAKGFELSAEIQDNLGVALEAIKKVYVASSSVSGVEKALNGLTTDSINFVKQHQGVWGHAEWEEFIGDIKKNSADLSEQTLSYLGQVAEAFKTLYFETPAGIIKETVTESPAKKASETSVKKDQKTKSAGAKKKTTHLSESHDDLTAIKGIGPAIAKKLNAHGIQSLAHIAALTDDEIANLEENIIKFSGRIKRDDWVGQAKKLT